jgi:hypothetical protein
VDWPKRKWDNEGSIYPKARRLNTLQVDSMGAGLLYARELPITSPVTT